MGPVLIMGCKRAPRASAVALASAALYLASPSVPSARAQARKEFNFLGPPSCAKATTACHKKPTNQWKTVEPQTIGADAHFNTRDRLTNDPKAREYLSKLRWTPDDRRCTVCHATVVPSLARGKPTSGVSCESCHGAGEGYVDVHQEIPDNPAKYDESLELGLADLRKGPRLIATACVRCHIVADAEVLRAGHPSGADWKADQALTKIVHWDKRTHSPGELKAAFDGLKAGRLKGIPAPSTGPAPAAPPQTGTTAPRKPGPRSTPAPAASLSDIKDLPPDFIEPATPAPKTPSGPSPATTDVVEAPPSGTRPIGRVNLAADEPGELTTTQGPAGVVQPVVQPVAPATAEPTVRSPLAEIVRLRQSVLDLVGRLLDRRGPQGVGAPELPAAASPVEYKGPDGELQRIQDEVLRLALGALRKPPPGPAEETKP